jgi:hypothetical protein
MDWSQENIKSWFLWNKPSHTLMRSKKENLILIAILNLFENKIEEYQVGSADGEFIYFSTPYISPAIDKYNELKKEYNNNDKKRSN